MKQYSLSILYFLIKWINCFNYSLPNIKTILLLIGIFSCFWGTLFALKQLRLKRVLIYSSIAQVGFIIGSLSLLNLEGFSKALFFTIIYGITSILLWSFIGICYYNFNQIFKSCNESLLITNLSGLFSINKNWALIVLLVFFSLGGIPPLTGFFSKAFILLEIIFSNNLLFAIFFLVISSFSMFYYL